MKPEQDDSMWTWAQTTVSMPLSRMGGELEIFITIDRIEMCLPSCMVEASPLTMLARGES